VADALASSLRGRVPAEVVATPGITSPETLVVRVSLERTVLGQEAVGPATEWTMTPTGTYAEAPASSRGEVTVSYAVTLVLSRDVMGSIRRYARDEGSSIASVEPRVLRAVVQDLVADLSSRAHTSDLQVTWTGDGEADRAIRSAIEYRSPRACEAISRASERLSGEQRGRALFAAARCSQALSIDASITGGLDLSLLSRASSLLEEAQVVWHDEAVEAALREIETLRVSAPRAGPEGASSR
jgi:hypothetical protein